MQCQKHKEVAMTVRRLLCWTLLGGLLLVAGSALAVAGEPPRNPTPRYLEPAPWWFTGPQGGAYYAVIAPYRMERHAGIQPPPGVKPLYHHFRSR